MKFVRLRLLIAYILLALFITPATVVKAGEESVRQFNILFLSSYSYSNTTVPPLLEGYIEGLDDMNVDISYEFMDADKYYGGIDIQNFDTYLRYKVFSKRNYDLLVVADDPALRYAINNRSVLFPDIPMVFMGVNSMTEAVTAAAMKNSTGIAENPDFEGNYALMKSLFPGRKHLNVIVDSSVAGQGDYVEFMKFKEAHPELSSTIVNTSSYTANGLKELLQSFNEDDVILFLDFTVDGDRNNYSLKNASEFLSQNAPFVPIFRLASSDKGHGVLGGITYSYFDAGRIAGEISRKILSGASADEMPLITTSVTAPFFEQSSMDRFDIKYGQLPGGSTVINERENLAKFYRENRVISNLAIVIVLLMIAIIFLLNNANNRRKKIIRTDFLTQMPNRKKLIEDMNQNISASLPYGIIMLDVDHFKSINDTFGHKVGDEIIVGVGERLKEMSGKSVTFARLGGDEFCGLFTSPSVEKAEKICRDIMKATSEPFETSSGWLNLTVSIGCAMYPVDRISKDSVIESADKALYATKERGRNGYTLFGSIDKA
jgi:diguanylate cyclase (GGDEF)-like protein